MEIGKIYVNGTYGPECWFGLLESIASSWIGNNYTWAWKVVNSQRIYNTPDIDNYYDKKLATERDIEVIRSILDSLGYELTEDLQLIRNSAPPTHAAILARLRQTDGVLTKEDKEELIRIMESVVLK